MRGCRAKCVDHLTESSALPDEGHFFFDFAFFFFDLIAMTRLAHARLARADSQTSKGLGLKTGRLKVKSRMQDKRGQENSEKKCIVNDVSGDTFDETIPPTTTKTRIPRIKVIGASTPPPTKPKKTPRIRIVGGEPLLSKIWADHGTDQANYLQGNQNSEEGSVALPKDWAGHGEQHGEHSDNTIKIKPKTFRFTPSNAQSASDPQQAKTSDIETTQDSRLIQRDIENDEQLSEDESDEMSLDSDCGVIEELANRGAVSKAPDHVHNVVAKWGKGTACIIEWGFRQETTNYVSKGVVVGRTSRKGLIKIKISYAPAQGSEGPSGFLYLPQTSKIRICSIRATKLIKIEAIARNLEEQAENVSNEDGQGDLEPLPPMTPIDSSFSVHVVAIFRAILRGYPTVELDSEKTAVWHKFLNAPRDSLATIRQLSRQNQRVGHIIKHTDQSEGENLSAQQREELGIDRRSIRNALVTARAGNVGKATRILDNVYKESALTADEKVQKLRTLHPEGPNIQIPEADFPRIGIVEKSEVRLAVEKLARGASPGPSGLSESMMRLLVDDEETCLSLCHMVRDVINGEIPSSVRKRLTRCRIIALPKPQNGIRPVAMGDTILKICGSILLQRHEAALGKYFAPIQRGVFHKNACESIVHELLSEYENGHALITVDFSNAYNTPRRDAITQALLDNPVFKPFMRMFYLEYGLPSELLFFAHNALFATIESSSGIRQGSSLSSMYFCALLQGPLREVLSLYPDVKIRARGGIR